MLLLSRNEMCKCFYRIGAAALGPDSQHHRPRRMIRKNLKKSQWRSPRLLENSPYVYWSLGRCECPRSSSWILRIDPTRVVRENELDLQGPFGFLIVECLRALADLHVLKRRRELLYWQWASSCTGNRYVFATVRHPSRRRLTIVYMWQDSPSSFLYNEPSLPLLEVYVITDVLTLLGFGKREYLSIYLGNSTLPLPLVSWQSCGWLFTQFQRWPDFIQEEYQDHLKLFKLGPWPGPWIF